MNTFIHNLNQPAKKSSYIPFGTFKSTARRSGRQLGLGSTKYISNLIKSFNSTDIFSKASLNSPIRIQPKLTINQPNDIYEQEADAVADKVMRMPDKDEAPDAFSTNPSREHARRKLMPSNKASSARTEMTGVSESLNDNNFSLNGSDKKMDNPTLSFMSNRFGFNLSNINIHTDNEAVGMNRELNARAFAVGTNIYFNEGQYRPESSEGKHLLAHELTHTLQQSDKGLGIQKDDKGKPEAKKPEINFDALPPDLKIRMWHLAFEADTSQVKLDYETRGLRTGLSYKYGGALALSLRSGSTSGSVGFTPGENQLSLDLSHGPFRAGVAATRGQDKYGLKLGFGDKLLPSPADVSQTFTAGGTSAGNLLTGAPGALDDPLNYYKTHKSDIDNVSKSVGLVKDITDAGKKKIRFGADFALSYDPDKKVVFTVRTGLIYSF